MKELFFGSLFIFLLGSCGYNAPNHEAASSNPVETSPAGQEDSQVKYPPITSEWLQRLFAEVDYIDVIFYNTSFTLSLSEKPSVQQFVASVAQEAAPLQPNCPSQGRIFYQVAGNVVMEADLHFIPGQCHYLVFYQGQKAMFANPLNPQGIELFSAYFKGGLERSGKG